MNTTLATRLLISVAVVSITFSAFAGSFWTQLDSRNIGSQPLAFKVTSEKTPQGAVLFAVYIESKDVVLSRSLAASLRVISGKNQIASVPVEKEEYEKKVRFKFEVSPKYLTQSKFVFNDMGGSKNPWVNDVYWFFLKDFSSAK